MGLFSKDIATMDDLFVHTLRDMYYAEHQIVKALPDMIEKATDAKLKQGFQTHLGETKNQIKLLEQDPTLGGVVQDTNVEQPSGVGAFPDPASERELLGCVSGSIGRLGAAAERRHQASQHLGRAVFIDDGHSDGAGELPHALEKPGRGRACVQGKLRELAAHEVVHSRDVEPKR